MTFLPRKTGLIIILCGVVLLPFVILFLRTPRVMTLLPFSRSSEVKTDRYRVQSSAEGYTLTLADTRYLDYVTAQLNLFAPDAIADPRMYSGIKDAKRMQVSQVQFVLVREVDRTLSTIVEGNGRETPVTILSNGDYDVQDDTLIIRVAVQFEALKRSPLTKKFAWENAFLRAAVNAMYYALGDTDPQANRRELVRMKADIDQNVYTGLFSWPFRIEETL